MRHFNRIQHKTRQHSGMMRTVRLPTVSRCITCLGAWVPPDPMFGGAWVPIPVDIPTPWTYLLPAIPTHPPVDKHLWKHNFSQLQMQRRIYTDKFWMHTPSRSSFLHFHAIFRNFSWYYGLAPPLRNPGSATEIVQELNLKRQTFRHSLRQT